MIRARHTPDGALVAAICAGPLLGRAFRQVRFSGEWTDEGLPVLMLANHFCWWDGFIQYRLNRALFHRKLHVMMLEEQLARHPFLNRCGCFSIKKNSRSMLETLDYCAELMRVPRNMVLLFPQGGIESMHRDEFRFQPGVGRLLQRIGSECSIVLNVNLTDYGSGRRPALNCYFRTCRSSDFPTAEALAREGDRFYKACKKLQCAAP